VNFTALLSRLSSACRSFPASARTHAPSPAVASSTTKASDFPAASGSATAATSATSGPSATSVSA
jgi:hypothetical protein